MPETLPAGDHGSSTVVLGLDPGSRCTGYGLVRERSGVLTYLEAGTIRPDTSRHLSVRLGQIFERLSTLIEAHQPTVAAVEDVFVSNNTSSALKLGQARGAVLVACATRGLAVFAYEPTQIKKTLVGVGRAGKDQVAFMVGQLLGVRPGWSQDSSDALAVAICHLNQRRLNRLCRAQDITGQAR
jgi:crossover junction endodeoxyribonuclease RuvC